jgi:hypothetical protein
MVTVVVACCLAVVSIASAASPVSGRGYVGASTAHPVAFQVSSNGKSISDFHIGGLTLPCSAASGGGTFTTTAPIKGGKFTVIYGSGKDAETFVGKFVAHAVHGTAVLKSEGAFGEGSCESTFKWSAAALAPNARLCPNHIGPPYKKGEGDTAVAGEAEDDAPVATNLTCRQADSVLDGGKYAFDDGVVVRVGAFTAHGWKCTETGGDIVSPDGHGNRYACSHTAHHESLSFYETGTPCGTLGGKSGPQCADMTAADRARRTRSTYPS